MQSKPGAPNVLYICNDGITVDDKAPMNLGITQAANSYDTDGSNIWLGPLIQQPNPWIHVVNFPAANYSNIGEIWEYVSKKYEIFNVNVTTEKSIYLSTPNSKRCLCILVRRPDASQMNAAKYVGNTFELNKSENGPLPYSFRRWLIGTMRNDIDNPGALYFGSYGWSMGRFLRQLARQADNYLASVVFLNDSFARFRVSNPSQTSPVGGWFDVLNPSIRDIKKEKISTTVTHELGHLLSLRHDTRGGWPGLSRPDSYYGGHNVWGPIMGNPNMEPPQILDQWAINDYSLNTNKENDIAILGSVLGFLKPPSKGNTWSSAGSELWDDPNPYYFGLEKFERLKDSECWGLEGSKSMPSAESINLGYNVRLVTKNDVKNDSKGNYIEGMIGFPYDFDLFKFILPKGSYQFTINNNPSENLGSSLDPQIDILNCHCHRSKENFSVSCDQNLLPGLYPEDMNFDCIAYDPCIIKEKSFFGTNTPSTDYITSQNFGENDGFNPVYANISLSHRSIVYVRVRGGKDQTPDIGWSRYGSVGKYKLRLLESWGNFLPNNPIPECHCEEFTVCNNNETKKIILYVQDDDENSGTQNQAEAHIKEYTIISNGELKTKKFLVYGPALELDAPEEDGKFYITVLDSQTNECKKQEFVIGSDWEKKKEE